MILKLKQLFLTVTVIALVGCGENPTSSLSEEFPILRSGPYGMEFAFIPNGIFRMGTSENHQWVKLTKDYWMQTTEVTRGQWHAVMDSYPDYESCGWGERAKKEQAHPVVCVRRDQIRKFIDELNAEQRNDGYIYRLPTEAEWEYAARAYTDTDYSLSGTLSSFAWLGPESNNRTHPVGELRANKFGLYDVHGNVWEMVLDWYGEYSRAGYSNPLRNPTGPESGPDHVVRSGCYSSGHDTGTSAFRGRATETVPGGNIGFRLVRIAKS